MPIHYNLDCTDKLLFITLDGTVRGHHFRDFSTRLYGLGPEPFNVDCIIDLLRYDGDVNPTDMIPLQKMYAEHRRDLSRPRPSFLVTLDPNAHLCAAALDHQFPGRQHYLASSLKGAFARREDMRRRAETG